MNKLFIACFLLLPSLLFARQPEQNTLVINRDSITSDTVTKYYIYFEPGRHWLFHEGYDTAMASPDYDDSQWELVRSDIRYNPHSKNKSDTFSNIGWFRLHFIADTGITNIPLALRITHYGASEIYLDGTKLISYGTIKGKDSTIYYDPQFVPLIFYLRQAGHHVLAVRYANYKAKLYYERNHRDLAGFSTMISLASTAIANDHMQAEFTSLIVALLIGFFVAFCIVHMFLYFFYRATRSNLYFSIFCLCLAAGFLIAFLNRFSHNPHTEILNSFIQLILISIGSIAFSGFTNELFSTKKLRFRIVAIACICTPFLILIQNMVGVLLSIALVLFVFIEAVVITIVAIYKKIKGARIIGAGILFFTLFFLFNVAYFTISESRGHQDSIDGSTLGGQVYLWLVACEIICLPVFMSIYLAWNFAYINRNLKNQLQRVELLSKQAIEQQMEKKRILEQQNELLEQEVASRTSEVITQKEKIEKQHEELKTEKRKSDDLLLNILPAEVAEELKEKGHSRARLFNHVTVLLTDFVNFTHAGEYMAPDELVNELHTCFKAFDEIISKYGIEKIKTIGDAYLAVCGLPEPADNHAGKVAMAALDITRFMRERRQQLGNKTFEIRVGIHSGSVVAGIVGVKKFAYDIWGDTVNTAARLEQHSEPGKINISQSTYELISNEFTCTYRGKIQAKNKGELSMYFIDGIK